MAATMTNLFIFIRMRGFPAPPSYKIYFKFIVHGKYDGYVNLVLKNLKFLLN